MISDDCGLGTTLVVTGKLAVRDPAGTVTLGWTLAAAVLSLDSATVRPPDGAAAVSVTVPVTGVPPTTSVGLTLTVESAAGPEAGGTLLPPPPPPPLAEAVPVRASVAATQTRAMRVRGMAPMLLPLRLLAQSD